MQFIILLINISICLAITRNFPFISQIVTTFDKLIIKSDGTPAPLDPSSSSLADILNDILPQLTIMQQDLTSFIQTITSNQCTSLKSQLETQIQQPIDSIFTSLQSYFKSTAATLNLNQIQNQCQITINLNQTYKSIQAYINQDSVDYVRKCSSNNNGYTKPIINKWETSIKDMSLLFVFGLKGCEKVTSKSSGFNLDQFSTELSQSIEYNRGFGFNKRFVKDTQFGLRKVIANIINKNEHARQSVLSLKKDYDQFHWHFIRYQTERNDNSHRYSQFAIVNDSLIETQATLCSSIHLYADDNNNNNKALVAWCLVDLYPLNNRDIKFSEESIANQADLNVQDTLERNEGTYFNYNLAVDFTHKWIETEGSYLSELKCQLLETIEMRMCWCASKKKDLSPDDENKMPVYLSNQNVNLK